MVILIAGLFALVARLNLQPSTSIAPIAVLSATGCGLLVTAIRKLHTSEHPGLFEAALGGLFLALFQFLVAISYPNVIYSISITADQKVGFLTTWVLIAAFSLLFSVIGATLGHLAFAPMRPLPPTKRRTQPSPSSPTMVIASEPKPGEQQRLFVGYFISVQNFLDQAAVENLICAVIEKEKPPQGVDFGIEVFQGLETITTIDLVLGGEVYKHDLALYNWSPGHGRLSILRDPQGVQLTPVRSYEFDHVHSCPNR